MTTYSPGLSPSLLALADTGRSTEAVIAEARRRQRRRRVSTAVAAAAAALAFGALFALDVFPFGGQGSTRQTSVRIYLDYGATSAETKRVLAAARAEHGVVAATIVSKAAALAEMRQRYPQLVAHLVVNPLPDAVDIRITAGVDAARLSSELRAKVPGIAKVRPLTQK
jgi:cell division protein FtsX